MLFLPRILHPFFEPSAPRVRSVSVTDRQRLFFLSLLFLVLYRMEEGRKKRSSFPIPKRTKDWPNLTFRLLRSDKVIALYLFLSRIVESIEPPPVANDKMSLYPPARKTTSIGLNGGGTEERGIIIFLSSIHSFILVKAEKRRRRYPIQFTLEMKMSHQRCRIIEGKVFLPPFSRALPFMKAIK